MPSTPALVEALGVVAAPGDARSIGRSPRSSSTPRRSSPRSPTSSGTVVDLGSGGGVPGLVIARARPDLRLVLVDRRAARTDHLPRLVRRLGPRRSGRGGRRRRRRPPTLDRSGRRRRRPRLRIAGRHAASGSSACVRPGGRDRRQRATRTPPAGPMALGDCRLDGRDRRSSVAGSAGRRCFTWNMRVLDLHVPPAGTGCRRAMSVPDRAAPTTSPRSCLA